ncbi:MAG: hypothetical protein AB7O37_19110 [Vicinamibacteria bacterium]
MKLCSKLLASALAVGVSFAPVPAAAQRPAAPPPVTPGEDALSAEIARVARALRDETRTDDQWKGFRGAAQPLVERAAGSAAAGRRLVALARLVPAWTGVEVQRYLQAHRGGDIAAVEQEWKRVGAELEAGRARRKAAVESLPAALRAFAEIADAQIDAYRQASLEYARATEPLAGFYYLGEAQAQAALVELLPRIAPGLGRGAAPPVRSVAPELDALDAAVAEAYVPPASAEQHPAFIRLGSTMKQARELDAAGSHYGALNRYLEARLRLAQIRAGAQAGRLDPRTAASRAAPFAARLAQDGLDHGVGRLFLELAEDDAQNAPADGVPASAAFLLDDVLPRYFEALQPPARAAAARGPAVNVTLVRWPYT